MPPTYQQPAVGFHQGPPFFQQPGYQQAGQFQPPFYPHFQHQLPGPAVQNVNAAKPKRKKKKNGQQGALVQQGSILVPVQLVAQQQ
jgi:hypothetical protein